MPKAERCPGITDGNPSQLHAGWATAAPVLRTRLSATALPAKPHVVSPDLPVAHDCRWPTPSAGMSRVGGLNERLEA